MLTVRIVLKNRVKSKVACKDERVMSKVRRIRLKNLFASKRIEANLDLIRLIFACFIFFAYLTYSLHLLIFA
jgi:hypothetical protein